jgi:FixJ family two-component response regulator
VVQNTPSQKPVVAVVDDDESVRQAVHLLLESVGIAARSFSSAEEFLASGLPGEAACLITDLQMPGMDGLELQARLAADGVGVPIIFITGHGDPRMRAQAKAAGALAFLDKPFDDEALLELVRTALEGRTNT